MEGGGGAAVSSMTQNQFSFFCQSSKICGAEAVREGVAMKLAEIDRIFLRANMDRSTGKFNAKSAEQVRCLPSSVV